MTEAITQWGTIIAQGLVQHTVLLGVLLVSLIIIGAIALAAYGVKRLTSDSFRGQLGDAILQKWKDAGPHDEVRQIQSIVTDIRATQVEMGGKVEKLTSDVDKLKQFVCADAQNCPARKKVAA